MDIETLESPEGIQYDVPADIQGEKRTLTQYVNLRFDAMRQERNKEEFKRDMWDLHTKAQIEMSIDGKARVNVPDEQALIELYVGTTPDQMQYKVEPEQRCAPVMLQTAEAIIDHFVTKEKVNQEIKKLKTIKAKYGTGILYSSLWFETKFFHDVKGYFGGEGKAQKKDIWHIGIKALSPRDVYFDERALSSADAMDCIYEENIGIEDFRMRYEGKKNFEYIDAVRVDPAYKVSADNTHSSRRNVKIWHYFNKITGRYCIIANQAYPIYIGYMGTKHGQLPFVAIQHYPRLDSLYGIGIPERIQSIKPYVNNFLKITLDSAWVSAAMILATSNNNDIDGEYYADPGDVNIWKFTADVGTANLQQINFQNNVAQMMQVLQLMDDYETKYTGLNLKAPYSSPATTAFEAGLMKEEQNMRLKPVAQVLDAGIQDAMNMMLSNISQYGPAQYGEFLFSETGEIKDFKPYQIRIEDRKIVENETDEGYIFQDDIGTYNFFDMTRNMFDGEGMKIKITTPSQASVLKSIERQEFPMQLQQAMQIKSIRPEANIGDGEEWIKRWEFINGVDLNKQYVKSHEQEMRDSVAEMMDAARNLGSTEQKPPLPFGLDSTAEKLKPTSIIGGSTPANPMGEMPNPTENQGTFTPQLATNAA